MKITACDLSTWLLQAKEDHTRYEERFLMEGAQPPEHNWYDWYARYIMQKIKDREYNELFGEADVTSCGLAPGAHTQTFSDPPTKQGEPWRDDYGVWHGKKKPLSVG